MSGRTRSRSRSRASSTAKELSDEKTLSPPRRATRSRSRSAARSPARVSKAATPSKSRKSSSSADVVLTRTADRSRSRSKSRSSTGAPATGSRKKKVATAKEESEEDEKRSPSPPMRMTRSRSRSMEPSTAATVKASKSADDTRRRSMKNTKVEEEEEEEEDNEDASDAEQEQSEDAEEAAEEASGSDRERSDSPVSDADSESWEKLSSEEIAAAKAAAAEENREVIAEAVAAEASLQSMMLEAITPALAIYALVVGIIHGLVVLSCTPVIREVFAKYALRVFAEKYVTASLSFLQSSGVVYVLAPTLYILGGILIHAKLREQYLNEKTEGTVTQLESEADEKAQYITTAVHLFCTFWCVMVVDYFNGLSTLQEVHVVVIIMFSYALTDLFLHFNSSATWSFRVQTLLTLSVSAWITFAPWFAARGVLTPSENLQAAYVWILRLLLCTELAKYITLYASLHQVKLANLSFRVYVVLSTIGLPALGYLFYSNRIRYQDAASNTQYLVYEYSAALIFSCLASLMSFLDVEEKKKKWVVY